MPSKNKKQNIKNDNAPNIVQEGDNIESSAYYVQPPTKLEVLGGKTKSYLVPPHLCEVYARIYNHIASGNILNAEEHKKHKAWLEQHRPR